MEFVASGAPTPGAAYLKPTWFLDHDNTVVADFAADAATGARTAVEVAVRLYYAVRDKIRYDPYRVALVPEIYRASHLVATGAGFCLPKANLLAAAARSRGIHAGIGLSDVKNHLRTERLERLMGGCDLFLHHGYAVMLLDGRWVKAAPAFNIELCQRFDVLPTEFDGRHDALFQQYDAKGRRHMEYVTNHGVWSDFPFERVAQDFRDYYPEPFYDPTLRKAFEASFQEEWPLI